MKYLWLCGAMLLLLTGRGLAAAEAGPAAAVSAAMSLEEIERALAAWPPDWRHGDARAAIAASLDRQVSVQVRDEMTDAERESLQPLLEFYRRRVDAGLDLLDRAQVARGVLVVKFYSSSLVLKTAAGTVAIDFCQGPINNGGEPETRDDRRCGFFLTEAQRNRLARLVDVSVITHRHHDHADYSLARRLVASGKPVVGPPQLKELWKDLADGITVPGYEGPQRFGPVELRAWPGRQYSRSRPDSAGQPKGFAPGDLSVETESIVYLLRAGGIVFLQAAENHVPADAWLRRSIAAGWAPQVVLSVGQYQGQRSIDKVLAEGPAVFRIPVHDHEMMHGGGGNRVSRWWTGGGRAAFDRRLIMPLFWGEAFQLTPEQVKQAK